MSRELVAAVQQLTERIGQLEKAARKPARISWRPREVADMTGLSYGQVMTAIHEGRLPAKQEGRLHVVSDDALRAFIAAAA